MILANQDSCSCVSKTLLALILGLQLVMSEQDAMHVSS